MFNINGLVRNYATVQDATRTISVTPAIRDAEDAAVLPRASGDIRFENVSFHYGKEGGIIDNLSLHIRPGERVAIVGPSGAGKTTIVNLMLRLFDVEKGRILIDGEPGNDLVPELAALPGETVLVKPGKGAFYATRLGHLLETQGISHLVFAGVTTEVCVQTTMREANDRGYECLLAEDATESYFPEFKAATLAMIRAQGGIVGWTAPTDAVVKALR